MIVTGSMLKYFSRYGEVIDCVVMKNPATGKSRGFGFVTFKDPACVEMVLSSGPHVLDDRQVRSSVSNIIHPQHLHLFHNHCTGEPVSSGNPVMNWRILLEHRFTTCTVLQPLYRSTCISQHLQLRTGGFCWCKVLLLACPC